MKAGLVLTTIFDPVCLEGYYENFEKYGHLDQVEIYVIPDVKTPPEAYKRCADLSAKAMRVHCPDNTECARFVRYVGLDPHMFPANSDNRRNIGYLMALAAGVDFVISIDDDNYCPPDEDYFAEHSKVCSTQNGVYAGKGGWLNIFEWMDADSDLYQRGFPYYARVIDVGQPSTMKGDFPVHANQGVWRGEPDLDAMTWVVKPWSRLNGVMQSFVVAVDTWLPFNSQNSAVRAEAMPAYYFIPMNPPLTDHFGDIFQGYFLQACMKHLGGHVRIGSPVVDHRRNSHNYLSDAQKELPCIRVLEGLLPRLTGDFKLSGSNYCEAYESLAEILDEWSLMESVVPKNMKAWAKACRTIGVGGKAVSA